MNDPVVPLIVSAPMLSLLTLEIIKWLFRKFIVKNPEHDFPPIFYEILIPFFTGAWAYGLAYVGWAEPVTYTAMTLVQWLLACVIQLLLYNFGIQPFKSYAKEYKAKNP